VQWSELSLSSNQVSEISHPRLSVIVRTSVLCFAVAPMCTCSERICLRPIIAGTKTFQLINYRPVLVWRDSWPSKHLVDSTKAADDDRRACGIGVFSCVEAETRLLYPARSAHVSGLGMIMSTSVQPMLALRAYRHCSPAEFRQILQRCPRLSSSRLCFSFRYLPLPKQDIYLVSSTPSELPQRLTITRSTVVSN